MKKKNILLFIVDSLNNTRIRQYGNELMPNFSDLKKSYCFCDSMFSQAPYTEAALMNLYCGQDVLQNNGYMYRFRDADSTVFELMRNKGYTTFFNSYQPQCYPSSLRRGVDNIYYSVGFDIGAFWSYRLSHYSELLKRNELTEKDYQTISDLLRDNFDEWLLFLNAIQNKDSSVEMIYGNAGDYKADEVKKLVLTEQEFFNVDEVAYINEVLTDGLEHRLFKIAPYNQITKIKNRSFAEQNSIKLKPLYRAIRIKNLWRNISSVPSLLGTTMWSFFKFLHHPSSNKKDFLKAAYYSINHLVDFDLSERGDKNYDWFKNAPSARTHLDHFFKWADEYQLDNPFFACVHVDDVHNPEVFLTYDAEDESIYNEEVALVKHALNNLPKGSKGSVTHDLSLVYIDNIIKYLVETMKQKSYGEDTSIVICADHGFSFSGDPIRDSFVTNLYLENYNMPFLVIDSQLNNIEIKGLRQSKDIPSFIESLANDSIDAINKLPEYSACTIEYCGGGCPDLSRRQLKLAAFNNNLFVGTLCELNKELTSDKITEVYDLERDPKQQKNLAGKINKPLLNELISIIERRRIEIKLSMTN